jgi:uncharacterized short protein YbdD (DUF466 family)
VKGTALFRLSQKENATDPHSFYLHSTSHRRNERFDEENQQQQQLLAMSGMGFINSVMSSHHLHPCPPPLLQRTSISNCKHLYTNQRAVDMGPLTASSLSNLPISLSIGVTVSSKDDKKRKKKRNSSQMEESVYPPNPLQQQRQRKHKHTLSPQYSVNDFTRYPIFYERQLNGADPLNFSKTFRSICEEDMVIVGGYVDEDGKLIDRKTMKHMVGMSEYEQYLQETYETMPDALFHAFNFTFTRTRHDLVITCEFTYQGTSMKFIPKAARPVKDLLEIRKVPTTAELIAATEECLLSEGIDKMPGSCNMLNEQSHQMPTSVQDLGDALLLADFDATNVDWLGDSDDIDDSISALIGDASFDNDDSDISFLNESQPCSGSQSISSGSYRWVPASGSTKSSPTTSQVEPPQYILDQFLPTNTKELIFPENSSLALGQSAEVNIRGKCQFYINNETMLIRRIVAFYRQKVDEL